ncbi:MAG: riboflavin synthase, partial [Rhizobiales bacterium]|nr:riboflavin synthase [Hyphomicrobiales bacterium]
MFTGIVTDIGEVIAVDDRGEGLRRVRIGCAYPRASITYGASISCAGICLTVVETGMADGRGWFAVDAAAETLRLTTAQLWQVGTRLNL